MRNTFLSALILCLASPSLVFSQHPANNLEEKVSVYMEDLQRRGEFSGVVMLARDGKILFARGYGMANLEHDVPNAVNTKFRLGSVTKQFTAVGIMMLEERKKLSVHDSICVYVHDCPDSWQSITIHQLLSHTSGIPSFTEFPDNDRYERLPMQVVGTIARFKDKPLDFPPGERFQYSDSGYLLLGYVIEQASGEKYEDFIRKNIYEPLHMQESGYDHPWVILKHRAQGYSSRGGSLVNATYMAMDTPLGAGSQYSTVDDLLLWDQALYTEKLLSQESLQTVFTPNPGPYPPGWLFGNKGGGYGYGWMIDELFGRKLYHHSGLIYGFSFIIMRYPADRTVVVVLKNQDEEFPGNIRDMKIASVGENLSAILFGVDRTPQQKVEK
jgi:CubicO group peptidase (beta-lactamase class C family)